MGITDLDWNTCVFLASKVMRRAGKACAWMQAYDAAYSGVPAQAS